MATPTRAQAITIDGLQLLFAGTGLAVVTAELLRALTALSPAPRVTLILPQGVALAEFELARAALQTIEVKAPRISPDYLFRAEWGRRVAARLRRERPPGRLFIPYLFNYGRWAENVVLLPDLVYRLESRNGAERARMRLPFRAFMRRFEEWKVTRARRIVVYSDFVRQHAARELHIPQQKFAEIRLAAPHWIADAPENSSPFGELLPERFALYVGGYARRKNVPMLLRACGAVHGRDATFRCVFAGLSPKRIEDDPELVQAWQAPGAKEAAVLLPQVENAELAPLYRRAEFAVYPSRSEGFGLPLVEAAACNRLCLCGDNSSLIELQPNPAYRVNADDETAWVERIAHFWSNPAACAAAGLECAASARRFSWATAAEQLLEAMS
jgi:glycosyltransferase involved in cell wall biosynthesis